MTAPYQSGLPTKEGVLNYEQTVSIINMALRSLLWISPILNAELGKVEPPTEDRRDGLVAYADGKAGGWKPNGTGGKGLWRWDADNNSWTALSSDISDTAPSFTLTDTTADAKSLLFFVNADLGYIREKNAAVLSMITLDLARNRMVVGNTADSIGNLGTYMYNFCTEKPATDPPNRFMRIGSICKTSFTGERVVLYIDSTATNANITAGDSIGIQIFSGFDIGTGTIDKAVALDLWNSSLSVNGTVTSMIGARIDFNRYGLPSANTVNTYGVRITRDTQSRTRKYGFYYGADAEIAEPAGSFAIYADTDNSYFGGSVGVGTSNPVVSGTGKLHLAADTFRLDTARTPASATAAGNAGEICWDANFLYTCIATNTWRRVAHTTW